MDESARQFSLNLESVSRALGEWTVSRQVELDPTLPERYGGRWRSHWVAETQLRLAYLAQAVAVRSAPVFVEAVRWAALAYSARAMGARDLANNLRSLREVLEAEMSDPALAPALAYLDEALTHAGEPPPDMPSQVGLEKPHGRMVLEFLEAVLSGRAADAERLVLGAADDGVAVPDLYTHVLGPALNEIGRMWHLDQITVADEHLATETTERVMSLLRTRFARRPDRGRTVVATAVGGELHGVGVRMVADFFELDGWRPIYLGANTPHGDVVACLRDHDAQLLTASATSLLSIRAVGELVQAVRSEASLGALKILVGGASFNLVPDLWKAVGADGFAGSAEEAVKAGNDLTDSLADPLPDA